MDDGPVRPDGHATARADDVPIRIVVSPGDFQTPDYTGEALAGALPDAAVGYCHVTADYDPHHCLFREEEGRQLLEDWLASTPE